MERYLDVMWDMVRYMSSPKLQIEGAGRCRGRSRTEDPKALALCSFGLGAIEGHKQKACRVILGSDEGGANLQSIRCSERVRLDEAFRVSAHDLQGCHLGPSLPCHQGFPAGPEKAPRLVPVGADGRARRAAPLASNPRR